MQNKSVGKRSRLLAVTGLMLLFCHLSTKAQTNGSTTQAVTLDETLESFPGSKVLSILMPKTVELSGDLAIALTVRIEPSFEEEFQYVFLKRRNGDVELIEKRSASGNIRYKIAHIEEQVTLLTVVEMATLINVLETRTSIPLAKFKQWCDDLNIAVQEHERREAARVENEQRRRRAGEQVASASRDGTRYVIWMAGERKYDIAVLGHSYKSSAQKGESPLIAWVRHLIKAL